MTIQDVENRITKGLELFSQEGRTTGRWIKFQIADRSNVMRNIPITTIDGIDPFTTKIHIRGPFDTSPLQTAGAPSEMWGISGSHTVLSPLAGLYTTAFGIYYGIRHPWTVGEPVFGLSAKITVANYTVTPDAWFTCDLIMPKDKHPYWGTTEIKPDDTIYIRDYRELPIQNDFCPWCETENIRPILPIVAGAPLTCPICGGWLND